MAPLSGAENGVSRSAVLQATPSNGDMSCRLPLFDREDKRRLPEIASGDRYLLAKRYLSPEPAFMSGSSGGKVIRQPQ